MRGKLARVVLCLVVLAVIAAATIGSSGTCCIGNICLLGGGDDGGGGGEEGSSVSWKTDVVSLDCADFYIVANGQTFSAAVDQVDVHSDPGWESYCTLEITWQESGVEMRLNMYFQADGSKWWSDEIRTYDGQVNGDWIYYTGKFFETNLGEAFTGSLEILSGSPTSKIHFGDLNLQAFLSPPTPQPVTGLALNKWETTLVTGSTEQLVATVLPPDAVNPDVAWSSTDNSVASVDESGLVSAVDAGTATITVTTVDQSLTASCNVTVVEWLELTIRDASDNQSLAFGEGSEVHFLITMRNPTDSPITLSCPDTQLYDIELYSSDNILVWNWARGPAFAAVTTDVVLGPGEVRTYEETWDQKDNQGNQAPTGTYAVFLKCVCPRLGGPDQHVSGPQNIEIT